MAEDGIVDHLLRHAAGAPMRSMFGRLGNWAVQGATSDATRGSKIPKVVAVMALDAGNALVPILKKVGLTYKSWEVAKGILEASRLILREAEWRINIPAAILSTWTVAVGYAADSGYEGWLEGTILRAGDVIRECGQEIKKKIDKRKEQNREFTNKDREKVIRKVVGDEAYEAAHKDILPEFFTDIKNLLKDLGGFFFMSDDKDKDKADNKKDKSGSSHDGDDKKAPVRGGLPIDYDPSAARLMRERERAAQDSEAAIFKRMIWEPMKPWLKPLGAVLVILLLTALSMCLDKRPVLNGTKEIDGLQFFFGVLIGVPLFAALVVVLIRLYRKI